jgi:hypothetical protein
MVSNTGFTICNYFSYRVGGNFCKNRWFEYYKTIVRITVWGTIAMVLSALVGYLFGVNV